LNGGKKKKKTPQSLTDLVMSEITPGRKGKVMKSRKGGRTPLDQESSTLQKEREPLLEDKFMEETLSALDDIEKDYPFVLIYLFQTKPQSCYGCGGKYMKQTL
jgi:hypothetical protein